MTTAQKFFPPASAEPLSPWTPASTPRCARWLTIGGALWVAHYAVHLGFGFAVGQAPEPGQGAFTLCGLLFCAALLSLDAGLLLLGAWLRPSSKGLALAGMALAATSALFATAGAARIVVAHQDAGAWGSVGVCLGAALLGLAARSFLPKYLSGLLLTIGLATFPLVLLLGVLGGRWVPAYLTDELPFALAGLAWMACGKRLQRLRIRGALR